MLETLRAGADAFLDHCLEPEVQQIVLLDAPAVLGWERWREIGVALRPRADLGGC